MPGTVNLGPCDCCSQSGEACGACSGSTPAGFNGDVSDADDGDCAGSGAELNATTLQFVQVFECFFVATLEVCGVTLTFELFLSAFGGLGRMELTVKEAGVDRWFFASPLVSTPFDCATPRTLTVDLGQGSQDGQVDLSQASLVISA